MNNQLIEISFPDNSKRCFPNGVTLADIAATIGPSLRKNSVAGNVNGQLYDLYQPITENSVIHFFTKDSAEGLHILRHTAAHILGQAVKRLFGEASLGVGPVIDNGFYYDFNLPQSLTSDDLVAIEKEMKAIIEENLPIHRMEVTVEEAKAVFEERNEHFKLELLADIPVNEKITLYEQGEFMDLCRGPHLPSTGFVKAFKLMRVSGAYWRGDSDNQVMQRIYGIAFLKKKELEQHLEFLEEAEKRDHRKLGKQLKLFMFSDEAPGMPFYLPNGQIIRTELENFSRDLQMSAGYEEVRTPYMMDQRLWEQSGHWDHYHENMYFSEVENRSFAIKPMNCPGHMLIFKNGLHSYRDLPIRMNEFGQVHRHEYSGALNGLLRVRTFCQDDAHLFVRPDQIASEIKHAFHLIDEVYRVFGFDYSVELSTRPEKSMGDESLWDDSEAALHMVLQDLEVDYVLNAGDGAFYGPKIDFHIKDALGRSHQCATIQLDFQMPEKFDLTYVDEMNEKVRPVVIHRAIFGSIDRFFGILIEHYGGAFPTWLAPQQVKIIPVSAVHQEYALHVQSLLKNEGIRVGIDERNEKLGYKVREAQLAKIPYTLIVGDDEIREGTVNVRKFGERQMEGIETGHFVERVKTEIVQRRKRF